MKKSKIAVNIANFVMSTNAPELFIKELVKLCEKHAKGRKGWFFKYKF